MKRLKYIFLFLTFVMAENLLMAQEKGDLWLKEAVIQSKVPKKLRTYTPFWGEPVPLSGEQETLVHAQTFIAARKSTTAIPDWVCWNLDLASTGASRYKMEEMMPTGYRPESHEVLRKAVDECYKWAWRKPYGTTCVVVGPLYFKNRQVPYAWYVAVCKKESSGKPFALGFSSVAFVIPETADGSKGIYSYSESVNMVESKSGYNLFPKLPAGVQELVEGMTTYELFCPFQEIEDYDIERMEVEWEHETDAVEWIIE